MLNKKEIEELFKSLEKKHGPPPEDMKDDLDKCVEPVLSVEGIRHLGETFDLPLETIRELTLRQYFWLSCEVAENATTRDLTFEQEEMLNDYLSEMKNASGIIQWLEQRRKKKITQHSSLLVPRSRSR